MDAWIDCMYSLSEGQDGMTTVHAPPDGCVVLQLENAAVFSKRCPDQYSAVIECTAFVNWRLLEVDEPPVLILSFNT